MKTDSSVASSTTLNRCRDRWGDVRNDFLSKSTREPETRALTHNDMWTSMCTQHGGHGLTTTEGVWYYKTKRHPHKKNTIYLLWRGESSVIILRAFAELTFMYDHLPGAKFVLLTGEIPEFDKHFLPPCACPTVTQGSNP